MSREPAQSGSGDAREFDAGGFRRALSSFATGVTIITARAPNGEAIGLTVNSFNSVSLNPPLVLWSLSNHARSLEAFRAAEVWAVHVLASDQEALSARFARAGHDKFAGLALERGIGDVPLLPACSARFQCRTAFQYEGGDHLIFVGEVLRFDTCESAPLVLHGGRYAHAAKRDPSDARPRRPEIAGSFGEDFLGYLLGRAHFRFYARIKPLLADEALSDEQFFVLSTLTLRRRLDERSLGEGLDGILGEAMALALAELVKRGLVRATSADAAVYELTEAGAACAIRVISAAKAVESEVLGKLGPADSPALKLLLSHLLKVIDPGAVSLWSQPCADDEQD